MKICVTGAGGFIGGHLVESLLRDGHEVRAVDIKPFPEWDQLHYDAENFGLDLKLLGQCRLAVRDCDWVYNLAADMGGMGFIETHKTDCMLSVLISTHMLQAASEAEVERFFYSSSACVYAADKQTDAAVTALEESDAYPAMPEDGYGWEKLFTERMCRHFREDRGLQTRVARYHNVYGPFGTYKDGREKAPAAICRKVATALLTTDHQIEIWGDGMQTRSFMWIEDCVKGTRMIANGDYLDPLNLGSAELVSINDLVTMVEEIAGIELFRTYNLDAPKGVRGRNSDNHMIEWVYGWEPATPLQVGMEKLYAWVYGEVKKDLGIQ